MYNILQLKQDIARKVHSGESADILGAISESIRRVLNKIDAPETKRTQYLEYGYHDNEYQYKAPEDLKDNKILDIRPQLGRRLMTDIGQVTQRTFSKYKHDDIFAIVHRNGEKFIHLNARPKFYTSYYKPSGYLNQTYTDQWNLYQRDNICERWELNSCNSLTDEGTWNIGGSATNLTIDKLNFLNGTGALRFDIDNNLFGYVENFTMEPKSIQPFMQTGSIFVKVFVPKKENLQTVTLKFGSSATDYYEFSVSSAHDSTSFRNGWNVLKFPLDKLIQTGFPDVTSIGRLRLEFQTNGQSMTDMRVDNFVVSNGFLWEIDYYSKWIVKDFRSDTYKERPQADEDILDVQYSLYNIIMLESAITLAQEIKYNSDDITLLKMDLSEEYARFNAENKSEYKKVIETYYKDMHRHDWHTKYGNGYFGGPGNNGYGWY